MEGVFVLFRGIFEIYCCTVKRAAYKSGEIKNKAARCGFRKQARLYSAENTSTAGIILMIFHVLKHVSVSYLWEIHKFKRNR